MKQYCLKIAQEEQGIILRFLHDEIRGEVLKLLSKHKAAAVGERLEVEIWDRENETY